MCVYGGGVTADRAQQDLKKKQKLIFLSDSKKVKRKAKQNSE
jgi:hypothetical protein